MAKIRFGSARKIPRGGAAKTSAYDLQPSVGFDLGQAMEFNPRFLVLEVTGEYLDPGQPEVSMAVAAYQEDHGLAVDGLFYVLTYASMNELMANQDPDSDLMWHAWVFENVDLNGSYAQIKAYQDSQRERGGGGGGPIDEDPADPVDGGGGGGGLDVPDFPPPPVGEKKSGALTWILVAVATGLALS